MDEPLDLEGETPQAALERWQGELASDPKHPYHHREHPQHASAQRRMSQLYALAYPGFLST